MQCSLIIFGDEIGTALQHPSVGFQGMGEVSEPEELESMSSGLGFSMLAKGMAKNVGEMQTSESVTDYVKRAIATTTPVVNSFVQWKILLSAERRNHFGQRQEVLLAPAALEYTTTTN